MDDFDFSKEPHDHMNPDGTEQEPWGEKWTSGTGQKMRVHKRGDCVGDRCVIHNPSQHCMSSFPTHWRSDRQLMERICPHGVGHPDPDDLYSKDLRLGDDYENYAFGVHGCDGCCSVLTQLPT